MPPFTPSSPAQSQLGASPAKLLDLVRQRLVTILGPQFIVTLNGDSNDGRVSRYHLAIDHAPSRIRLEDSGDIRSGFIEHLLRLGAHTRKMIDSATFSRMCSDDPQRPLVWLSDTAS